MAITRWTTPIDDHTCRIIGWRHMHPDADPRGLADESLCGVETVDFFGQNGERPYADRQRMPGDYDAQISQRPIAVHAMENLTRCDRGVAMLRQLLRRESRKIANGEAPAISPLRANGATPTYAHDTVVSIPPADTDDAACVREIGKAITAIVVKGDHHEQADRPEQVRERIRAYAAEQASTATSE